MSDKGLIKKYGFMFCYIKILEIDPNHELSKQKIEKTLKIYQGE